MTGPYLPQTWIDQNLSTPLDAARMTYMEQGIAGLINVNVYNVKSAPYGAKGDGVTIDSTAIQNCINACISGGGGIVWIPKGTYVCSELFFGSDVTVQGAGPGATILLMDGTDPSTDNWLARICPSGSPTWSWFGT